MKNLIPIAWLFGLLSIASMILLSVFKVDNAISTAIGISELVILVILIFLIGITPSRE